MYMYYINVAAVGYHSEAAWRNGYQASVTLAIAVLTRPEMY